MGRVIFLGTAAALPSANQDNTCMLVENTGSYVMLDCSGTPYRKLLQVGVDPASLDHVVITHHHIDHCFGLISLIECLWIAGREKPLHIYALVEAFKVLEPLMDLFNLRHRMLRYFPIQIHPIEGRENELIIENEHFSIRTTPTYHAIPSVATKVILPDGTNFVYSSDTAPCQQLIDFASGADHLVMECTYCDGDVSLSELTRHIHSSQWGEIALKIGAKKTYLVHHSDTPDCSNDLIRKQIKENTAFPADQIIIPRDLQSFELN